MRADRVDVSWDAQKSQWLIRITSGEEVLRRHVKLPNNADAGALQAAARQTVSDEGYEVDPSQITVARSA